MLTNLKRATFYGFVIWLIPFLTSFLIYPLRESNRPLFESVMPVLVVLSVVVFAVLYFKKDEETSLAEGFLLGVLWMIMSTAVDLLMFVTGPIQMTFIDYIYDIGITYLLIPITTAGFGYVLQERTKGSSKIPP